MNIRKLKKLKNLTENCMYIQFLEAKIDVQRREFYKMMNHSDFKKIVDKINAMLNNQ